MADTPNRAVAVVGPTASGKTALSLRLAERFSGEIVGCDSMQIYLGMDIGTAKATAEERARVPHHLIDLLPPDRPFSAADYADLALCAVRDITSRGRLPILCGGTGLYLEAARSGRHEGLPPVPDGVREALLREAEERGAAAMHAALREVDPISAAAIHPNNTRRVLRALEIYRTTGRPKSELDEASRLRPPAMELLVFGLFPTDRDVLRERIDRRVDAMVAEGLREEVAGLLSRGLLPEGGTAAAAIGYKEYVAALRGELTEAEAIREIKVATHRYARRQLTWFRAVPDLIPLDCDGSGVTAEAEQYAIEKIEEFIKSHPLKGIDYESTRLAGHH